MRTFFVVNPQSANGQTGRRWPEIQAAIARALGEFKHAFTERPMHASALAAHALSEGWPCVAAVGGDGTVNEVVNGFFAHGGSAPNTLALVPRGTGGDFRRTFGWEQNVAGACRRLAGEATRLLDVGLLTYATLEGGTAQRRFVNVASFGVSGQVDREVNRGGSKRLGGRASFFLGSFRALWRYRDQRVRMRFDGGPWEELPITAVAVANGRYFGGGMQVAPGADPADGLFDVTIWSGYGLSDFALKSPALYSGAHVKLSGTRTLRARTVEAQSDEEVLIDVDGEQPGRLPCRMEMLPGALRLKV